MAASRGTTAESSLSSTSFSNGLRPRGTTRRVRARWLREIALRGLCEMLVLVSGGEVPSRVALAASSNGHIGNAGLSLFARGRSNDTGDGAVSAGGAIIRTRS